MVARDRGFIVNVSSVAAFAQSPYNTSYCATKAWMNSFTEGLYLEMRKIGADVRVQALCPGYTYTDFHQTMGLTRDFAPKSWWMSADDVVEESLASLAKNKLFAIPGLRYKLIVALLKLLPKKLIHANIRRSPSMRRAEQRHDPV
jgi:short-subunit dehydrogenase